MHQRQSSPTVNTSKQNLSPTRLPFWTGCGFGGTSSRFVNVPMTLVPCVFSVRSNRVTVSGYLPSGSSFCGCPLKVPAHVPLKSARDAGSARESRSIDENKRTTFQRTLQCGASQVLDESIDVPSPCPTAAKVQVGFSEGRTALTAPPAPDPRCPAPLPPSTAPLLRSASAPAANTAAAALTICRSLHTGSPRLSR